MKLNIPPSNNQRIVIAGAGFAGLKLARCLDNKRYQIVIIDKNNYHQFQPLFYQVATAGLEANSITFPLRKIFQKKKNIHIRYAKLQSVDTANNEIITNLGALHFDHLILCLGLENNYYNLSSIKEYAFPMKSVTEALQLRNAILENYEQALTTESESERNDMMSLAIIGGGPTGVEIAGAIAEMKKYILPKDFPELNFSDAHIYLIEGSNRILRAFSEKSSHTVIKYLKKLGVEVMTDSVVTSYDGTTLRLSNGQELKIKILIWSAGVSAPTVKGLDSSIYTKGNRISVDSFNKVKDLQNVYAIGDIAFMTEKKYPNGHPQVAQVALQQAKNLAKNLNRISKGKPFRPFKYIDCGTMATVGKNRAIVELPFIRFGGFIAWLTWTFIHLMAIVGVKNRLLIFINWAWNYLSSDKSFRFIYKYKN